MKANHCFNVVLKNMSMWQLQDSHQSLPSLPLLTLGACPAAEVYTEALGKAPAKRKGLVCMIK